MNTNQNKINTYKEKVKKILSNKNFVNFIFIIIFILFFIITNSFIKNNIYETNNRSFIATIYAKITKMPAIKINNIKISYNEYYKFYDYLNNFYKKQNEIDPKNKIPSQEHIKEEVVSKLIKNALLDKLSSKYKVNATDREIFDQIVILNSQTGSLEETEKNIKEHYGISINDFKKEFIRPIILKNKLNEKISNDTDINKDSIEKITNIYNQIKESNNAETINKLGQKIDLFSTLAREKSEDNKSSEAFGDLGWLSTDIIEEPIKSTALSMQKGEYSNILKSKSGYHIIKLLDKVVNIDIPKIRIAQIFVKSMDIDTYLKNEINNAKIKIYIK